MIIIIIIIIIKIITVIIIAIVVIVISIIRIEWNRIKCWLVSFLLCDSNFVESDYIKVGKFYEEGRFAMMPSKNLCKEAVPTAFNFETYNISAQYPRSCQRKG